MISLLHGPTRPLNGSRVGSSLCLTNISISVPRYYLPLLRRSTPHYGQGAASTSLRTPCWVGGSRISGLAIAAYLAEKFCINPPRLQSTLPESRVQQRRRLRSPHVGASSHRIPATSTTSSPSCLPSCRRPLQACQPRLVRSPDPSKLPRSGPENSYASGPHPELGSCSNIPSMSEP
jgi:hypothetical protein